MRLLALLFLCTTLAPLYARTPPKDETVRTLIELSGAGAVFDTTITQGVQLAITQIRAVVAQQTKAAGTPDAPPSFYERLEQELTVEFRSRKEELLSSFIVPVYIRHFTQEEVEELIRFYGSPLGRKLAQRAPLVAQESMRAGAAWGQKNGEEMMRNALSRIDLSDFLPKP